ncbi:hypothetical protein [Nocardioides sp.]|uniref:hypothetical protein n=1 Tax=Nocardioides sp. TaxID=35761 RepID=UPI0039E5FCE2
MRGLLLLGLVTGVLVLGTGVPGQAQGADQVKVPKAARAVKGKTTTLIGDGTPASCTSAAVVAAVAQGGLVRFDCGPHPVTIAMTQTAKVVNTSRRVVIDGGGLVTLDGQGSRRIIYQNTCDQAQVWTTSHCDDQPRPRLVLQHLTLAHGYDDDTIEGTGGGGAVFARGGRLRIVDTRFVDNACRASGFDVSGAAVRAYDQYRDKPVQVSGSTFTGGRCSSGGAIGSIGVSWSIYNSTFTDNRATGQGASDEAPGGGNGGAIALDGNRFRLLLAGSTLTGNVAPEGGGAIFFVSNDLTGTMRIRRSTLRDNPSLGFENQRGTGIFFLGRRASYTASIVR